MVDYCIVELQDRARAIIDPANPPPVLVFDVGVYRSDNAVSPELKKEIQDALNEFESRIPEKLKDWHPNSDKKVLDLVHPSLYPLVYGQSRILPNGEKATLDDCVARCGEGVVIPVASDAEIVEKYIRRDRGAKYSKRFQWLPCEVDISGERPK